jgi:hypothetical protein
MSAFPGEVAALMAEHLVDEQAFESAANLNRMGREYHAWTSPVLWETVTVAQRDVEKMAQHGLPSNLKLVQYVTFTGGVSALAQSRPLVDPYSVHPLPPIIQSYPPYSLA